MSLELALLSATTNQEIKTDDEGMVHWGLINVPVYRSNRELFDRNIHYAFLDMIWYNDIISNDT